MSSNRATGRKLQILSAVHNEPLQLDLLSFVMEHTDGLVEEAKVKLPKVPPVKSSVAKVHSYHFHGNVDQSKSFANFRIGKSNQFAVEGIKRFISSEKNDSGLIFLRARSGHGKSHLLHAIGNEMQEKRRSFYFSSPLMMSPVVDTLNMLKFYDIILIDDIEEIEGKSELQKIFCQLIDYAQTKKIKLIVTGSKKPLDLNGGDDRFKGKLSQALVYQIEEMDNELAHGIVSSKAVELALSLPEDAKQFISNQLGLNTYGIEGLLYKLKSLSEITGQEITLDVVKEEITGKKAFAESDDLFQWIDRVAESFQLTRKELMSQVRKMEFALARHVAMYILKEKLHLSVMKIADFFDKDHSSVLYGIARIRKLIDSDSKMRDQIEVLLRT